MARSKEIKVVVVEIKFPGIGVDKKFQCSHDRVKQIELPVHVISFDPHAVAEIEKVEHTNRTVGRFPSFT